MLKTIAQQFRQDPRVKEAKRLLKQALYDYQKALTNYCPADPTSGKEYAKLLERCQDLRGGNLYFPYLSSGIGQGPFVELADGSVKYDFITGIGTHYLGHSHPRLLEAGIDAALEDTVMQGNLQQSAVTVEVMELLVSAACRNGASLKHCFLTSSGAMANENALKMIFQKRTPARRWLAFERCFAGRSLAMAQITDKPENRKGLPKVLDVDYIPFFNPDAHRESTDQAVQTLEKFLREHPGEYAGMMFEMIQGEGGYYPGERDFFAALIAVLKKNNIAVMIDEIQTFGRTGEPFAFQYFGLDKDVDVVTVGKLTQVCATLFTDAYKPEPGLISQTFTASSSALHAARTVLKALLEDGFLGPDGKIVRLSRHFREKLEDMARRYPDFLRGPFGLGAMIGCTVFDGSADRSRRFLQELFQAGVAAFVAGKNPVRIRFLLPIGAITTDQIDEASGLIEETLVKVGY